MVDDETGVTTPADPEAAIPLVRAKRRLSPPAKAGIAALALAGIGAVSYPLWRSDGITTAVDTSDSEEFQQAGTGSGIGRIDFGEERKPETGTPEFDPSPFESELEQQRRELEARNAKTLEELDRLKAEVARVAARPQDDTAKALADGLDDMQAQTKRLLADNRTALELQLEEANKAAAKRAEDAAKANAAEMTKLGSLISAVQRENDALQNQFDGGMAELAAAQAEASRKAQVDADRQAELDKRQAEARKLRDAQIRSEAVVFDVGGSAGGNGSGGIGSGPAETGSGETSIEEPQSPDDKARAFVMAGAEPVEVTSAEVIGNPSHTILQGTIIAATLETAIDSQLPGQIAATVNYPVYSFDQSQVLIPEGSRLFGTYDSDVSLGRSRVLVGWTRLVTPDGQSVELAAFGADDQGRSGLTGKVNSRFGLRFGSAALLSIVGAAPSIAAANADSRVGAEIAEDIGDSFSDTTSSVVGAYASLPPIISVQPGAALSVIVDRDLEFY